MILTAIVAMDQTGLIGDGLQMPWHLPRDLKRFRKLTIGKPVILGRKTYQSLGKPLPDRLNIVLTRDPEFAAPGCRVATSVDAALEIARAHLADSGGDEAMIIGGAVVYEATVPLWDRLLVTIIEGTFPGNTYFPTQAAAAIPWHLSAEESHKADDRNPFDLTFLTLDRQHGGKFSLADRVG